MALEEVTNWKTATTKNVAHHPTGPQGNKSGRISASFREFQAAIARWNLTVINTGGGQTIDGSLAVDTLTATGNINAGTKFVWSSEVTNVVDLGLHSAFASWSGPGTPQTWIVHNAYYDASDQWRTKIAGFASLFDMTHAGDYYIYTSTTTLAENALITWSPSVIIRADDSVQVNGNINAVAGGINLGAIGSANLLDDYEEGTWTPVFDASGIDPTQSYADQIGTYTKVGNMVSIVCNVRMAAAGISGGTGAIDIAGLPFTVAAATWSAAYIGESSSWALTTSGAPTSGLFQGATTKIRLYVYQNDAGKQAGMVGASASDIKNSSGVIISGTYKVD